MKLKVNVNTEHLADKNRITIKNSLERVLYVGGEDVTKGNGFVVLPRQNRIAWVHDGQELWGCTEMDDPQLLCIVRSVK